MRLLTVTFTVMLALTAASSAQEPQGIPLMGSQSAAIPTLAPLVKKVTPSVVNIAVKGRIAQEQNTLLCRPAARRRVPACVRVTSSHR